LYVNLSCAFRVLLKINSAVQQGKVNPWKEEDNSLLIADASM